jgi:hypothetical protein
MLKAFLLIVVGLAGNPEHGELFTKWGTSLAESSAKVGVTKDRLIYLSDTKDEGGLVSGRATREEIDKAFATFAKTAAAEDVVYVVLFGHGTFDGSTARFNLPGPDMTPADFNNALRKLPVRNVVFVNTASASAPFVETLSAQGRTIITATRTGSQQFATLFGGYFVEAFSTAAADGDKNGRLSMLEAFEYARTEVARTYKEQGLLATEQALLDDNGDKVGSQTGSPTQGDGKLAASMSLGSVADAAPLPEDPKLRALYVERRDLERRVEALRLLKDSMPPAKYVSELERLVTELALKTREIRTIEGDRTP